MPSWSSGVLGASYLPGGFDLLHTVALSSSATQVVFQGLSNYNYYDHLQLRTVSRVTNNFAIGPVNIYFNDQTLAGAYSYHKLANEGTNNVVSTNGVGFSAYSGDLTLGSSSTANTFAVSIIDILDFSSSSKFTTLKSFHGYVGDPGSGVSLSSGLYARTAPITSLYYQVSGLVPGTRLSIYGVR